MKKDYSNLFSNLSLLKEKLELIKACDNWVGNNHLRDRCAFNERRERGRKNDSFYIRIPFLLQSIQ